MQPLFHIYEAAQKRMRLGMAVMLLTAAVFFVGVFQLDLEKLSLAERETYILPFVVPFLASLWLVIWQPPQGVADGLRMDAEGLSFHRGGRSRGWRWSEVSDFRVYGRLHPAALVLGRAIAFRVPVDHRQPRPLSLLYRVLFVGRNAVIWDHYLSDPGDMARDMARYRDHALGSEPRPAAASAEPAIYHHRPGTGKTMSTTTAAVAGLSGLAAALVMMAIIAMFVTGVWPRDWATLEALVSENEIIRQSGTFIPIILIMILWSSVHQRGRNGNLLLLSSDGLHIRAYGERRHWLWHEISTPELRRIPEPEAPAGGSELIGFLASHDGKRPGKGPAAGPLPSAISEAIEDIYDAPLDVIARQILAWHGTAGSREDFAYASEPLGGLPVPQAGEAEAVSFRRRWAPATSVFPTFAWFAFFGLAWCGVATMTWVESAEISRGASVLLLLTSAAFGVLAPLFFLFIVHGGSYNILRFDRDGLTYVRLGRIAGWSWRDLSSVELRAGSLRWSREEVPLITFTVPRDDRLSRFMRWAYRILAPQPLTVIEDIYDTPPGEIARQLNEYRGRALGDTGGATS